ncbi:MAG: hypothetical protein ACO3ZZ_05305, partial [Solirubrobacterales bacterium]
MDRVPTIARRLERLPVRTVLGCEVPVANADRLIGAAFGSGQGVSTRNEGGHGAGRNGPEGSAPAREGTCQGLPGKKFPPGNTCSYAGSGGRMRSAIAMLARSGIEWPRRQGCGW